MQHLVTGLHALVLEPHLPLRHSGDCLSGTQVRKEMGKGRAENAPRTKMIDYPARPTVPGPFLSPSLPPLTLAMDILSGTMRAVIVSPAAKANETSQKRR
jgi:hypothetical protein